MQQRGRSTEGGIYVRGPVQQLQDQGQGDRQGRTADQGHRGPEQRLPADTGGDDRSRRTYDLSGKGVGNTARVTLTDTDGPANGGDFAAKTVDIEFTEAERTAKGDGDWDQGAFAKSGVDIALEEKE